MQMIARALSRPFMQLHVDRGDGGPYAGPVLGALFAWHAGAVDKVSAY